ncbi:hypothetical protein D3C71_1887110 [compost metagenome]
MKVRLDHLDDRKNVFTKQRDHIGHSPGLGHRKQIPEAAFAHEAVVVAGAQAGGDSLGPRQCLPLVLEMPGVTVETAGDRDRLVLHEDAKAGHG